MQAACYTHWYVLWMRGERINSKLAERDLWCSELTVSPGSSGPRLASQSPVCITTHGSHSELATIHRFCVWSRFSSSAESVQLLLSSLRSPHSCLHYLLSHCLCESFKSLQLLKFKLFCWDTSKNDYTIQSNAGGMQVYQEAKSTAKAKRM